MLPGTSDARICGSRITASHSEVEGSPWDHLSYDAKIATASSGNWKRPACTPTTSCVPNAPSVFREIVAATRPLVPSRTIGLITPALTAGPSQLRCCRSSIARARREQPTVGWRSATTAKCLWPAAEGSVYRPRRRGLRLQRKSSDVLPTLLLCGGALGALICILYSFKAEDKLLPVGLAVSFGIALAAGVRELRSVLRLNGEPYDMRYDLWAKRWMCGRCGTIFMPRGADTEKPPAVRSYNGP